MRLIFPFASRARSYKGFPVNGLFGLIETRAASPYPSLPQGLKVAFLVRLLSRLRERIEERASGESHEGGKI